MSFGELLFLALLALLVFGPRKLPEIARSVAKVMAELRKASNEFRYSLEEEIRSLEIEESKQKRMSAIESAPPPVEGTVARPADPAPAMEDPVAGPGDHSPAVSQPSEAFSEPSEADNEEAPAESSAEPLPDHRAAHAVAAPHGPAAG